MYNAQLKATVGAMLRDIGKILDDKSDNYSMCGASFVEKNSKITDDDILDQIKYHQNEQLSGAVKVSDYVYVSNFANNVSSKLDGIKSDDGKVVQPKLKPLDSIFNTLNGNDKKLTYNISRIGSEEKINYPIKEKNENKKLFEVAKADFKKVLNESNSMEELSARLLTVAEKNLSFVSATTKAEDTKEISLYEHMKMTAAIASSVRRYMDENKITDFKALMDKKSDFINKNIFLLYNMSLSGVYNFIYTSEDTNVIRELRARAFYVEMLMNHSIDTLLEKLGLTRANLVYSCGENAYLLLPNTDEVKVIIDKFEKDINKWFIEYHKIDLNMAFGYSECSANSLCNSPIGSYQKTISEVKNKILLDKKRKYSAEDILKLNSVLAVDTDKECKICHRMDNLISNDKCKMCSEIENISDHIIKRNLFVVSDEDISDNSLPLPFNCYLSAMDKDKVNKLEKDNKIRRVYSKNELDINNPYIGVWMADYNKSDNLSELAKKSAGIERIAVMKINIDDLVKAFSNGFENSKVKNQNGYTTLSKEAELSNKLSLFFKLYVNKILETPEFTMAANKKAGDRNISVLYSLGDDLLIVGSWEDVVEFAVDLNRSFERFTQGTLTLSAGIDIYPKDYPVSVMIRKAKELENLSKNMKGKNTVTITREDNSYTWNDLDEKVFGEKCKALEVFFKNQDERGNRFAYNILELFNNREEKINIARLAYTLARLEPQKPGNRKDEKANKVYEEEIENYKKFSKKTYEWIKNEEDSKQMRTAILLYVYNNRNVVEG